MTANELNEQTIAAFAARLKDPKTPLEALIGATWIKVENPAWRDGHYRIKPWTIGREINGHVLPEGREWHRTDFTRKDLPEGWRPLMHGELAMKGDQYGRPMEGWSTQKHNDTTYEASVLSMFVRTRRPIPAIDPIAGGHNPDKLTVSQVGEGWRLLDEDEVKDYGDSYDRHKPAWTHETICNWLDGGWRPGCLCMMGKRQTYRTRLTRAELAALDKPAAPKTRPWNCVGDVPMPICWVRNKNAQNGAKWLAHCVCISGIHYSGNSSLLTWHELSNYEYSTDGKTFQKCEVTL